MKAGFYIEVTTPREPTETYATLKEWLEQFADSKHQLLYAVPDDIDPVKVEVRAQFGWDL